MGGSYDDFSPEARRHILFLNLVVIIGIAILGTMALKTMNENNLPLTIFDGATGVFLFGSIIYLRLSKNYIVTSWLCLGAVTALYFFLLATGGSEGTGALWLLSYPFIAVFLVGLTPGIVFTGLMFTGVAFFFVFPRTVGSFFSSFIPTYRTIEYSSDYVVRVLMSYLLSTALAIFYEAVRKSTQKKLSESMEKLEKTTGDLLARRTETDSILQNVREGIFLLDREQCITSEYSKELESILGKHTLQGTRLLDLVRPALPDKMAAVLQDYLDMLYAPDANRELLKEINPIDTLEFNLPGSDGGILTKHLEFDFTIIGRNGHTDQILGTVRDVTSEVKLVKELEAQEDKAKRQIQKLSEIINIDPALMKEFIADAEEELENINLLLKSEEDNYSVLLPVLYQSVHAVKGNALLLGLTTLGNKLHAIEDQLNVYLTRQKVEWKDLFEFVAGIGEIRNEIEEIKSLIDKLMSFQSTMKISGLEQKNLLLTTLRRLVDKQSRDTGKDARLILTNFHTDAISPRFRKLVKEVLIQIIRNALAHGIESAAERARAGKPRNGMIQVSCEKRNSRIWVTVRDDGAGLDPDVIRHKAKSLPAFASLALDTLSDAQTVGLIFKPGFSTASQATLAAGRGIGMSMIKKRIEEHGGQLKVRSAKGKYTEFEISLPT